MTGAQAKGNRRIFRRVLFIVLGLALAGATVGPVQGQTVRAFDLPQVTTWKPVGTRGIRSKDPVLGSNALWRQRHSDAINSDETTLAIAPVFELDWVSSDENGRYHASAVTVDREGNIWGSPLMPGDGAILVCYDGGDGSERFVITGENVSGGGSVPLITDDPDHPGQQIVYLTTRGEAMAVKTDGTILWRKPSPLPPIPEGSDFSESINWGPNYHPVADALISVTGTGILWAVSRKTGEPVLTHPYPLPGSPSPAQWIALPPPLLARVDAELRPLIPGMPEDFSIQDIINVLLGGSVEVANYFAIHPGTGRIWVAATAPDEDDGTADGISEYGALYALDLVPNENGLFDVQEACRVTFQGGSSTTPSLNADGSRVYVADAVGNLLAIDNSCQVVWTFNAGQPIQGSPAISVDNDEIYMMIKPEIAKVLDRGDHAELAWITGLDMYENLPQGMANANLMTLSVGANGVAFQGGAGPIAPSGNVWPTEVGAGLLDRETGRIRWFAGGSEESVAMTILGPDGSIIIPHSPIRRILARVVFGMGGPVSGGVSKFRPVRRDLLIRDISCAAADRDRRAADIQYQQEEGSLQDVEQVDELVTQALRVAPEALASGEITHHEWRRTQHQFLKAEFWQWVWRVFHPFGLFDDSLDHAAAELDEVCESLDRTES